jgi:YceI-like domain
MKMNGMVSRKVLLISLTMLQLSLIATAQDKYFTKSGTISFFSDAPMEKIEAINRSTSAVLDTKTGNFQFVLLMKGFEFKKALMQEHFNENYVESEKFPKASFKGTVTNNSAINYGKDGTYEAVVKGKLTIHGQEKEVTAKGNFTVKEGKINTASVFTIKLSDYQISIPALVKDKVAEQVRITVNCLLAPLKQ